MIEDGSIEVPERVLMQMERYMEEQKHLDNQFEGDEMLFSEEQTLFKILDDPLEQYENQNELFSEQFKS